MIIMVILVSFIFIFMISMLIRHYFRIKTEINHENEIKQNIRKNKEHFLELNTRTRDIIRENQGLEKCNILYQNLENMSNESFQTMINYVDGLRLKKWKPYEDDLNLDANYNKENYCYLYDDSSNKTQDYILTDNVNSCSKNNPLFSSALIKRVFSTQTKDKAHNIPIRKCVFEIDKEKLKDADILNKFWQDWHEKDCQTITFDMRDTLRQKKEDERHLASEKYLQEQALALQITINEEQDHFLSECMLRLDEIHRQLQNIIKVYESTKEEKNQILSILNQLNIDIEMVTQELNTLLEQKRNTLEEIEFYETKLNNCQREFNDCEREKADFQSTIDTYKEINEQLHQSIIDLRERINRLRDERDIVQQKLTICEEVRTHLEERLEHYTEKFNRYNRLNQTCQLEREEYISNFTRDTELFKESERGFFNCRDTKEFLENNLKQCQQKVDTCINNIDHEIPDDNEFQLDVKENIDLHTIASKHFDPLINEIDNMKRSIVNHRKNHESCMLEKTRINKNIEELQRRSRILEEDINKAENHQSQMKNDSYKKISDNVRDVYNEFRTKYIKAIDDQMDTNIENKCTLKMSSLDTEYEDLEKESKNLESRIKHFSMNESSNFNRECKNDCPITVAQCMIHKNNREICTPISSRGGADGRGEFHAIIHVFDQANEKSHTLRFRHRNERKHARKTGGSDIKYFIFESDRPRDYAFKFYAFKNSSSGSCGDNMSTLGSSIDGEIDADTTYRKVELGPDYGCLFFTS